MSNKYEQHVQEVLYALKLAAEDKRIAVRPVVEGERVTDAPPTSPTSRQPYWTFSLKRPPNREVVFPHSVKHTYGTRRDLPLHVQAQDAARKYGPGAALALGLGVAGSHAYNQHQQAKFNRNLLASLAGATGILGAGALYRLHKKRQEEE
jgi:hypothetical protein